ncbi:MAG TPA: type IVB secretion system protein IcmJDotN, partial [Gammaproteobacteria bacterium]|nr:type IVB secretion system protein IcmJDotN [Gammaproteobacteria bacterium]
MPELKLAVNLTGWRLFIKRRSDRAFEPIAKRLLERDHYTCQYCGFQAQEYQEIVNLDGNYLNNKNSNLVTACCFCSQCFFLQSVGVDEMGGGQVIYLPEMSQADLNSFCHVLFVAMGNTTGFQDGAQTVYRSLRFRSQVVENKLGAGSSNPATLGQLILEYQESHPQERPQSILQDLRLLPSFSKFKV